MGGQHQRNRWMGQYIIKSTSISSTLKRGLSRIYSNTTSFLCRMHCNHHLTSFTSEKMNVLMIIMKQLMIGLLLTQEQLTAMDAKPRYTKKVLLHIRAIKSCILNVILFFDILLRNSICFVLENLFVYEPVQLGSVVPETIVDL